MINSLQNSFFVAWRYLKYHRLRSLLLVTALAIILLVPIFIELMISNAQQQLLHRANATPLLLGTEGSSLDLTINTLHFNGRKTDDYPISQAYAINKTDLARAIPINTRFKSRKHTIVGTTHEYFNFRKLALAHGRAFKQLGEAVIGSQVAEKLSLHVNDTLISNSENLFDIAGTYPLQLKIVGILKPADSADNEAIFTDIKNTWIMAGIGHGHDILEVAHAQPTLAKHNKKDTIANFNRRTFNVINQSNIDHFHFHGDETTFPINAAIVVPKNHKALSILLGRYQEHPDNLQLIQPKKSIQALLVSIFRLKKLFYTIVATISLSTFMTLLLAFMLSIRLRAKEIETIFRMGCSRGAVTGFIAAEISIIALSSLALATVILFVTQHVLQSHILSQLSIFN